MPSIYRYPVNADPMKDGAWIRFTAGEKRLVGSVYLPTPANLSFSTNLQYNDVSLGVIEPILDAVMNADYSQSDNIFSKGGTAYNAADSAVASGMKSLGSNSTMLQAVLANEMFSAVGLNPFGKIGSAVSTVGRKYLRDQRVAINPNTELYFKNVSLRNFNFSFTLVAKSQKESYEIKNIVDFFHTCSLPEKKDDSGFIFSYPEVFKISFLEQGVPNAFLPVIKDCVITSFTHNYNTMTNAFNRDGSPINVDISISFRELVVNTRETILGDQMSRPINVPEVAQTTINKVVGIVNSTQSTMSGVSGRLINPDGSSRNVVVTENGSVINVGGSSRPIG